MPKVTIWIKDEDYDKWQAITDRPAWLHEHLNQVMAKADGKLFIVDDDKFYVGEAANPLLDMIYTVPEESA